MITVVIPLYNKAQFIAETIQSVLGQTYADFELIIVNDGSTDNSAEVVNSFGDDRLRLISIENAGVSVARNRGIQAASHPWIAFLDGDDWWAPNFLEEMGQAIQQHPNHALFASGRSRVFASEAERYTHEYLPADGTTAVINYFKVISKFLPLINASNVIIKKSHFDSVGFFKVGQKQHEDHDLWMRLAVAQEVVFVNKELSFYRKTEGATASHGKYLATDFKTYLTTMLAVLPQLNTEEQRYFRSYANRFCLLTYLKNYGSYTKGERRELSPLLTKILKGNNKRMYQGSNLLPFDVYPILKRLKG